MARLALVNAGAAAATAVRAAARGHEVVGCDDGRIPAGVDLVIAEGAAPDTSLPVLLLCERGRRRGSSSGAYRSVEMPCELFDLRAAIDASLEAAAVAGPARDVAPATGSVESPWLSPPRIPADAADMLAAAARLGGTVWIFGESGTGTGEAAAALGRLRDAGREPVLWDDAEPLGAALARLDDPRRVLRVPDLDRRPATDQRAFARFLEGRDGRRVVVTTGDDPQRAVADGRLVRDLLAQLSAVALRLPPLRERRDVISVLSQEFGLRTSSDAFGASGFVLRPAALRTLESYDWPGNVVELEGVVVRSVIARGGHGGEVLELDAGDLVFAPAWLGVSAGGSADAATATDDAGRQAFAAPAPGEPAEPPAPASPEKPVADPEFSRRAVVVALPVAERAAEAVRAQEQEPTDVEALLAAFAHEIRNPMSTIRTYASLRAADESAEDAELARLAADACERLDEHLASLQRFAELDPEADPEPVDLVEILAEAADSAGVALESGAREPLKVVAALRVARLVADLVVAECGARGSDADGGQPAIFEPAGSGTMRIRIPAPSAAVDRLGKWVRGAALPWRLALARDASRRAGGDLEVDVEDGELRLAWRLPPTVQGGGRQAERPHREEEDAEDGGQARSTDRRRRSRSS